MTLCWPSSGSSEKIWACPRRREKSARKKCRIGSYDIFAVALAFIEDGRHCPWCFVFFNHQPISLRTDGKPHFLDLLERISRRINSPQMTSQPATSCSTSSSRPFQTPVEEFRSLFRTGMASSTSIPRFHTRWPVGMSFEDNLFFLMGVFHQSAN